MLITTLWFSLALLVLVGGVLVRLRLGQRIGDADSILDSDAIRAIVEDGALDLDEDEPLDENEARDAERRFWEEERWEDSEEF